MQPRFYLMTPSLTGQSADVVCLQMEGQVICLDMYRKENPKVSLLSISEADACKLMLDREGIGLGCYIHSADKAENDMRAFRAEAQMLLLAFETMCLELPESRSLDPDRCEVRPVIILS